MKLQYHRFLGTAAFSAIALSSSAFAVPLYKVDNSDILNLLTSWSTTSGAQTPNSASFDPADVWYFNDATVLGSKSVSLGGDITIAGLGLENTVGTSTNVYDLVISSGSTLTLNGGTISGTGVSGGTGNSTAGIILNRGTGGALTINTDIIVGATQQWVTSRGLTTGGNVDLGSDTARTLTVNTTTTALPLITGVISCNLTKSGNGTLYLNNAANSFGGIVAVAGGNLKVDKLAIGGNNSSIGSGSSAIVLNGGTLNCVGSTTDTTDRAIEMRAGAAINNNGTISFTAANVSQALTASARTMTLDERKRCHPVRNRRQPRSG
jgi:fibronectin-binding autotransporter adhesin